MAVSFEGAERKV